MSYDTSGEVASRARPAGEVEDRSAWAWSGTRARSVADTGARIRIYTLGRFSLAIDGRPMSAEGKAKQRPLALLKALIALGGRAVASSHLWECLWPDSEGDLAVRNLTVTLHRLRHLLGTNASILQHDGKLTVNDRVCWVDVWSFERAVNAGLDHSADYTAGNAGRQLRAALDIYRGHFLAREAEESWMLVPRLRLRIQLQRVLTALVCRLEEDGRFEEAIDLCLCTLERDPLNETLHRSLIGCYLKSGEIAEALRAYLRCREALAQGLGAAPSPQTERLYSETMHGCAPPGPPPAATHAHGSISLAGHGRSERVLPDRKDRSGSVAHHAGKVAFPPVS